MWMRTSIAVAFICAAICAAGCGQQATGPGSIIVYPLERITGWQARPAELALSTDPSGDLFLDVQVSTPRLGDGLTLATRVHRDLNSRGITNEIHCTYRQADNGYLANLHIDFPQGLEPQQEDQVRMVLQPVLQTPPGPPALVAEGRAN
jgi:hypothetical protein